MKFLNLLNLQSIDLKESISNLLGARLQVGQTLHFTYHTIYKRQKKKVISLSQFLQAISFGYPRLSRRTLQRAYRVFERLVVGCGFWITDLEEIDFVLLSKVAECRNITPLTRRELVVQIRKRMEEGESYAQISKKLDRTLAALRESPPRIPQVVLDTDRRLADVKMDFRLVDSAIEKGNSTIKIPDIVPDLHIHPVDQTKLKW